MADRKICPKCGKPLTRSTHGQFVVDICKNCSYQINVKTGKVIQGHDQDFDEGQMLNCPKCNAELCAPKNRGVLQLDCPFCLHEWIYDTDVSDSVNTNEEIIVTCPECGTQNRMPDDYENYTISCGECSSVLYTPNDSKPSYQQQTGLFDSIVNYFKERKESAEAEENYIWESPLTHYIGDLLLKKMNSLRTQLHGCTKHDYFSLEVYKTSCNLYFHEYDLNERKYKSSRLIEKYNYPMIQNIFKWEDGYTEIKYHKARKWFRQVVYNEHMVKCGYIIMDDFGRMGILRSQL